MEQEANLKQPKVIFLDAVGTLFGVKGSVGKVYAQVAQQFGVEVSDQALNQAFYDTFASAEPLVFPGVELLDIPYQEFLWWQNIAKRTFEKVGALSQFSDFSSFFSELHAHFTTTEPWFIYPDVRPALQKWRQMGISLGVISNFDSRIYAVLQSLRLADFFTSITICSEAGAAKPDGKIFTAGLEKHHCSPEDAWHIGDSYQEDYQGAKAAGIRAILIKRDS